MFLLRWLSVKEGEVYFWLCVCVFVHVCARFCEFCIQAQKQDRVLDMQR